MKRHLFSLSLQIYFLKDIQYKCSVDADTMCEVIHSFYQELN